MGKEGYSSIRKTTEGIASSLVKEWRWKWRDKELLVNRYLLLKKKSGFPSCLFLLFSLCRTG